LRKHKLNGTAQGLDKRPSQGGAIAKALPKKALPCKEKVSKRNLYITSTT